MTVHSFGVALAFECLLLDSKDFQGILATLAMAVHNIPEGLAASVVLASRVSPLKMQSLGFYYVIAKPHCSSAIILYVLMHSTNSCIYYRLCCQMHDMGCRRYALGNPLHLMIISSYMPLAVIKALKAAFQNLSDKYTNNCSGFSVSLLFGLSGLLGGFALLHLLLLFILIMLF